MKKFVIALEQTAEKSRCVIFNKLAEAVGLGDEKITAAHPKSGWVEFDAAEIWNSQLSAAKSAMKQAGLGHENIAPIGITNQRETIVLWDAKPARRFTTPSAAATRVAAARSRRIKSGGCSTASPASGSRHRQAG